MNTLEAMIKIEGGFERVVNEKLAPGIKTPDFVYHYSSIGAFLNMSKSNELWFTHASFMNDPLEIEFGISVIMNILEKHKHTPKVIEILTRQQNEHKQYQLALTRNLAFIFSLSEVGDSLPQWIQYGSSGNGVCLEFINTKILTSIASELTSKRFAYFPVQYYSNDFTPLSGNIRNFEDSVVGYFKEIEEFVQPLSVDYDINASSALFETTRLLASLIKSSFHAQEKEWRFVIFTGRGEKDICLASTEQGAKMYYALKLKSSNSFSLLNSVMVGPNHFGDRRIGAVLDQSSFKEQNIFLSVNYSNGVLRNAKT